MAAKHRKIRSIFSVGTITLFVFLRVATAQTSTATSPTPANAAAASDDKSIRPFHFTASEEALADMRDTYARTLDEGSQEEYEAEFNRAVKKRWPPFGLEIENR